MFLKQLQLTNIRSYIDETIKFPEGSTILSGDIGCGKSSILLAVEFALFGTSRPDLPAELLLRKGANKASVELSFKLNEKEITIQRNLKKEKSGIKQMPGHIIINSVKKELMPVEMKAEILSMLGYPEDILTKNKNYIFRYTVYTPQEDMKFILQENADARLDVLRKIFNIDKYKIIRDNLQLYLKELRSKIAQLKIRLEPMEEYSKKFNETNLKKTQFDLSLKELEPKLQAAKNNNNELKKELISLENKQRELINLQQQQQNNQTIISEKNKQISQIEHKLNQLNQELDEFFISEDLDKEQLMIKIKNNEIKKQQLIQQKSTLQERINQLHKKIQEQKQELNLLKEEIFKITEKERLQESLTQKTSQKSELENNIKQLEDLYGKTNEVITKNQTILQQSQELKEKISNLDNCPLCLQDVNHDHKNKIQNEEVQKIQRAKSLLIELNQKKEDILNKINDFKQRLELLREEENKLIKIKVELVQLYQKRDLIQQKEDNLKSLLGENNQFMVELNQNNHEQELQLLNEKLIDDQKKLEFFTKKELLKKQLTELNLNKKNLTKEILTINQQLENIINLLKNQEDYSEKIESQKRSLEGSSIIENQLTIKKTEISTHLENTERELKEVEEKIKKFNEWKSQLIRTKELYHWLENHFIKLTMAIEKQVMVNIHSLFNNCFQEWFSTLIEDENIFARIDDSFTPVIEQNGFEISFNNLSGGEKTSAALAYRLALNRVINDVVHEIKTKSLLILDEPTDGFSSEQLDKVRDVLERLNLQQTILVSHESKIESFVDNVIRIHKEDHRSVVMN